MAPRCALGRLPHYTGTRKWLPYGGSSLYNEVFSPLERIELVFNAFQWAFSFRLMRISLNSDLNGTNYPRQARHHCIFMIFLQLHEAKVVLTCSPYFVIVWSGEEK